MNDQSGANGPAEKPASNPPLPAQPAMSGESNAQSAKDGKGSSETGFSNQHKKSDSRMSPYEYVNLFFSGLTFVALVVAATVYYYQLCEMKKAADASKKSADAAEKASKTAEDALKASNESSAKQLIWMQQSADASAKTAAAATQAAKTAVDSLNANIDASHLDQRAWVGIKDIFLGVLEAGKPLAISMTIVNSGKTVARDATCRGFQLIAKPEGDFASAKRDANLDALVQPPRRAIFPSDVNTVPFGTLPPLPADVVNGIKSGIFIVYIGGDISYKDVFGVSHTTQFYTRYNPGVNGWVAEMEHNDAD
jgi:hypothetical protein